MRDCLKTRLEPAGPGISLALMLLGFCVISLSTCARLEPKEEYQVPLAEKQIKDMETKIDEIYHRVSMIQFMVENHERSITNIEKTLAEKNNHPTAELSPLIGSAPAGNGEKLDMETPNPVPAGPVALAVPQDLSDNPEMLYNGALAAYKKMDYNTAVSTFTSFAEQYPGHELADNALYWIGECYYAQKRYSDAIPAFKKVASAYPEGSKVPDALLKTGYAYLATGDKDNGRLFLKNVVRNYPFSPAGVKAEKMLQSTN